MTTSGQAAADDVDPAGRAAPPARTARPGRIPVLVTAIAAGLLAVIHAGDLLQLLLGLPYTATDIVLPSLDDPGLARGLPLNLLQTLTLIVLTSLALIGGAVCIGRGSGAARIGGVLAAVALALPATMPMVIHPFREYMTRTFSGHVLFDPYLYATSGLPLLAAAIACAMLAVAARRAPRPVRRVRYPLPAVLTGGVFALAALATLIRWAVAGFSWWAFRWAGLAGLDAWIILVLTASLTAALTLGAVGAGRLLGAASLLGRVGGGLLLAAVLLRMLSQVVIWGLHEPLQGQLYLDLDVTVMILLDTVPVIGVAVLSVLGVLLAILGLFVGTGGAQRSGTVGADRPA